MATGIDAYLNSYLSPSLLSSYGTSSTSQTSSVFDYQAAQKTAKTQAAELLASYKESKATVSSLKTDTAKYLDQYALSMKTLGQSADKLRNGNLDKLLYDKDGQVTDATVEKTVKSVQDMVDKYNSSLKLLNDNADRGPGTMKQLSRMATDPAPAASMKMVGVTVNKDGTLALDSEKMTEALKTTNSDQLKLYKDIIGGYGGIADGAHKDALFGSNMSARELIQNDLASIQTARQENPFREMYDSFRGNVFTMNNQAVTGMLMNLLV